MKPVGAAVHIRRKTPYWPVVAVVVNGVSPRGVGRFLVVLAHRREGQRRGVPEEDDRRGSADRRQCHPVPPGDQQVRAHEHDAQPQNFLRGRLAIAGCVGLLVGILVGLTSVGSKTLERACLLILFPAMLPSRLVGTGHRAGRAHAGGRRNIAHAGMGDIDPTILFSLLLGQVPGVFIGARVSSRYNGQELRWLLLVLVGAGGISLLGAPACVGTTVTVVGVLLLGVPILLRARARRTEVEPPQPSEAAAQDVFATEPDENR